MIDILQLSNQIFGSSSLILCEDNVDAFSIKYEIDAPDLPSAEGLADLCNKCLERDDMEIRFYSAEDFTFKYTGNLEQSEYEDYKLQLEQDDTVKIEIRIQKKLTDEIISVYSI